MSGRVTGVYTRCVAYGGAKSALDQGVGGNGAPIAYACFVGSAVEPQRLPRRQIDLKLRFGR
jgi:hypothetical protein